MAYSFNKQSNFNNLDLQIPFMEYIDFELKSDFDSFSGSSQIDITDIDLYPPFIDYWDFELKTDFNSFSGSTDIDITYIDLYYPFHDYWDYELTQDQYTPDYIFSDKIQDNGLLFNFDFNSSDTIININDGVVQYIETPTFSSKQYTSGFTLTNIGLNAINIGSQIDGKNIEIGQNPDSYPVLGEFTATTFSFTGETLTFVSGDTNLKLWRVFPYGTSTYDFPLQQWEDKTGNYIDFGGGYFNGFYKLYGYPYQLFPTRFNLGWTAQFNLNTIYNSSIFNKFNKLKLNDTFTGNTGFFLYFGVRQENKFYDSFTGITSDSFNTILSGISTNFKNITSQDLRTTTGVSLDPYIETQENNIIKNNMLVPGYGTSYYDESTNSYYDWSYRPILWSGITDNVLGFRVTPDYKLGYRRITTDKYCVLTAFTYTNRCGEVIITTGYTQVIEPKIVEEYSPIPMFTGHTCNDCNPNEFSSWVNLTIKWERDYPYETDCQLQYGKYKNGTLKTYVNGRLFWVVTGFTEFIPYQLPTDPSKQEGVPFTISLGGGSSGLFQSQVSYLKETPLIWDNINVEWDELVELWNTRNYKDFESFDLFLGSYTGGTNLNLWIHNYFAGTFLGGISSFRMYEKPLNIGEIRHNYNIEKCRYNFKGNFGGRLLRYPDYNCNYLDC